MISNFLYNLKNTDKTTLFISLFIIVFFGFYVNQLPFVIVGIVIIFVFSSLSSRFIIRLSLIGLCIASILCVAILFFDYEILGSKTYLLRHISARIDGLWSKHHILTSKSNTFLAFQHKFCTLDRSLYSVCC